jgi:hypothetical protein
VHFAALTARGYRVVGVDLSADQLTGFWMSLSLEGLVAARWRQVPQPSGCA